MIKKDRIIKVNDSVYIQNQYSESKNDNLGKWVLKSELYFNKNNSRQDKTSFIPIPSDITVLSCSVAAYSNLLMIND